MAVMISVCPARVLARRLQPDVDVGRTEPSGGRIRKPQLTGRKCGARHFFVIICRKRRNKETNGAFNTFYCDWEKNTMNSKSLCAKGKAKSSVFTEDKEIVPPINYCLQTAQKRS